MSDETPPVVAPAAASSPPARKAEPVRLPVPTATALLGAALVLGLVGDALLRSADWGLNLALWLVTLGALAVFFARQSGGATRAWLVVGALVFAAAVAWRDSRTLQTLDLLALFGLLGLAAYSEDAARFRLGLLEAAAAAGYAWLLALAGLAPSLVFDVRWRELPNRRRAGPLLVAGRGLLLSIPLLLVFGGLFSSADAGFEALVRRLFDWDLADLLANLWAVLLWAWLAGGWLRQLALPPTGQDQIVGRPRWLGLGIGELGIALGSLDLLFLVFVVLQLPYLFGGAARVQAIADLTYAEYARRGFFELVTVAALALAVLLGADWALRRRGPRDEWLLRALAVTLVALLFVVLASALQRMLLYQAQYGLTELRLYVTACIGWLAVVFLWLVATVLRGRRERFAAGALAAGLAALIALTVLNPDDLIARVNLARTQVGAAQPPDVAYLTSLSADAVPALVGGLPGLPPGERRQAATTLLQNWSPAAMSDWRSLNLGRLQARQAIEAHRAELERLASGG
jgi:hypothetical protein